MPLWMMAKAWRRPDEGAAGSWRLMMDYVFLVNLKDWAEREGLHHVTAYRWLREGKLPVPARRVGRLILVDPAATAAAAVGTIAVYALVSSTDQWADLDRRVARVTAWAWRYGRRAAADRAGRAVAAVTAGDGPACR